MMKSSAKLILIGLVVVAVVAVVIVAGGGRGESPKAEQAPNFKAEGASNAKAKEAPNFKAKTLNGTEFELNDLRGRVVLMDFWATYCLPCREAVPELQKLWKKYKDRGLLVVGIAVDRGNAEGVREFIAEHKLTYWQVHDSRSQVAAKYKVRFVPTAHLLDTKGAIRHTHVGIPPGGVTQLEREIEELLPSAEELKKLKPLPPSESPAPT